jgi:hypothetical protein
LPKPASRAWVPFDNVFLASLKVSMRQIVFAL